MLRHRQKPTSLEWAVYGSSGRVLMNVLSFMTGSLRSRETNCTWSWLVGRKLASTRPTTASRGLACGAFVPDRKAESEARHRPCNCAKWCATLRCARLNAGLRLSSEGGTTLIELQRLQGSRDGRLMALLFSSLVTDICSE